MSKHQLSNGYAGRKRIAVEKRSIFTLKAAQLW